MFHLDTLLTQFCLQALSDLLSHALQADVDRRVRYEQNNQRKTVDKCEQEEIERHIGRASIVPIDAARRSRSLNNSADDLSHSERGILSGGY